MNATEFQKLQSKPLFAECLAIFAAKADSNGCIDARQDVADRLHAEAWTNADDVQNGVNHVAAAYEFSKTLTFFDSIAVPLVNRGLFVCPAFPKDKLVHTRLVHSPLTQKTNDADQIHAWGLAEPNANVIVYAEQRDGGVLFLDKDGGISLVEKYEHETGKQFPRTLLVQSSIAPNGVPKGHWYFYQTPRTIALEANIPESKTDGLFSLRVNNYYVVSIGSLHPKTGLPYKVADEAPIIPMPDEFLDWLLSLVQDEPKTREEVQQRGKFAPGTRYTALMSELGRLNNRGYSREGMVAAGLAWARDWFDVPEGAFNEKLVKKEIEHFFDHGYEQGVPSPDVPPMILNNSTPDPGSPAAQQMAAQQPVVIDPTKWRDEFCSVGELEDGPIVEVISGVLQEGTCFFGANAGDGKTLVALAFAKAISTGTPLFGIPEFTVPKPYPVVYLIPETRDRAFRKRCKAFRIPDDKTKFMARTMSKGTMVLDDVRLLQAMRDIKPVVILDTAARFMKTQDENSSAQNQMLVNDVTVLLQAGAVCVILIHHATKASQNETPTLENMLRGTGDFAAMCDMAYGIRKDRAKYANGNGAMEIDLVALKDRELIGALTKLRLAASRVNEKPGMFPTVSIIDETGNFHVVGQAETIKEMTTTLVELVKSDPTIKTKEIAEQIGMTTHVVRSRLNHEGWFTEQGGSGGATPWHEHVNGVCPYELAKRKAEHAKQAEKAKDERAKAERDKAKAERKKPGIEDAITFLKAEMADLAEDEYTAEEDIVAAAKEHSISMALVKRAAKALNITISVNGEWSAAKTSPESGRDDNTQTAAGD